MRPKGFNLLPFSDSLCFGRATIIATLSVSVIVRIEAYMLAWKALEVCHSFAAVAEFTGLREVNMAKATEPLDGHSTFGKMTICKFKLP